MVQGYAHNITFEDKFDLVILGFFLYLVDREDYLKVMSEADRLTKSGGFLAIIDFDTSFPYSNQYVHKKNMYSHKINNAQVLLASGLYSLAYKYSFSHDDFCFNEVNDQRLSIMVLFKEKEVFK